MVGLLTAMNWLLPLLYLGLLISYGTTFFLRTKTHARNHWLPLVIVFHVLFLVLRAMCSGHTPLVSNYEILSVLALSTAAAYFVVELASRDRRSGMFVFLPVFLFQYTSSVFLLQVVGASENVRSNWVQLHIIPAIMAYTGFTISAVYGMLHLAARRNLKRHRIGLLFDRLPPLDLLGEMTWYALLSGFAFMTIAIATSPFIFCYVAPAGGTGIWDPRVSTKIIIGSVAWLIYMVAILGKAVGRWTPSRVSGIAVNGFFVVMVMLIIGIILS